MTGAVIGAFLLANWYWILIAVVILIGLSILSKAFNVFGILWKIIKIPFKVIWKFLKVPFRAIRNARTERKNADRRD